MFALRRPVLLLILGGLATLAAEEPPPSPSVDELRALLPEELRYQPPELTADEGLRGLLPALRAALAAMPDEHDDALFVLSYGDLETLDDQALAAVQAHIDTNGPALELFEQAIERPRSASLQALEAIGPWTDCLNLLKARTRLRLAAGDLDGAFADVAMSLRAGGQLGRSAHDLMDALIALSVIDIACSTAEVFLDHPGLTDAHRQDLESHLARLDRQHRLEARPVIIGLIERDLLRHLPTIPTTGTGYAQWVRQEAERVATTMGFPNANLNDDPFLAEVEAIPIVLDPIATVRRIPPLADQLIEALQSGAFPEWSQDPDGPIGRLLDESGDLAIPANPNRGLMTLLSTAIGEPDPRLDAAKIERVGRLLKERDNPIGRGLLCYTFDPSTMRMIRDGFLRTHAHIRLLRARIAIHRWQAERNAPLTTFDPTAVDWPDDPFDGQPLRFDAERRVIWSIGKNRSDDGGEDDVEDVIQQLP